MLRQLGRSQEQVIIIRASKRKRMKTEVEEWNTIVAGVGQTELNHYVNRWLRA